MNQTFGNNGKRNNVENCLNWIELNEDEMKSVQQDTVRKLITHFVLLHDWMNQDFSFDESVIKSELVWNSEFI